MKNVLYTKEEVQAIPKPFFDEWQIKEIRKKTPASEIETRSENGFTYKSVKASYMKKRMNYIFGWRYNFEIISKEFNSASKEIIVHGKLTIHGFNNSVIIREQFGKHFLNTKTYIQGNTTITHPSDFGDGYKSAASDAFKKCCSEIGLCWDIYSQELAEDKKEAAPKVDYQEQKILERLNSFLENAVTSYEVESTYNKFLQDNNESEASQNLLQFHLNRFSK